MIESGSTRSLVANLPKRSLLVVHKFCTAGETLIPDLMAPEAQSDRSYVRELSGLSNSLRRNLAWWAVT